MKNKLFLGIIGFLLASSAMFAGWGVGFGAGWYGVPGIAYAAPVYGHYYRGWIRPYVGAYLAPLPYAVPYAAPAPNIETYVGPPPFFGAIWIPGRWIYGPHGRYWVRGYWGHRR